MALPFSLVHLIFFDISLCVPITMSTEPSARPSIIFFGFSVNLYSIAIFIGNPAKRSLNVNKC